MKNYIRITTITGLFLLATASCKKFVAVDPPGNELTTETVFSDSVNARHALTGIYIGMMEATLGFGSGGITLHAGLSADELKVTPDNPPAYEFFDNHIDPLNENNYALWFQAYELIYKANACIEGIEGSTGISGHAMNSLVAEAKTLRAFFYFNLVNLYGAVPLLTTTDYSTNKAAVRTEPALVYAQVEQDLRFARQYLEKDALQPGMVSYYAATALLAKVLLYQQQYDQARQMADEVITSGLFQLEANPAGVFTTGSQETIWALVPVVPGRETWEGYSFLPGAPDIVPPYIITDTLFNVFEPGDNRKEQWISVNIIDGIAYPYPYKYKNAESGIGTPEQYTVLRLAEQYLVRAEAAVQLGDLAAATADVNLVRQRAGLGDMPVGDKSMVLDAIARERRSELFCEWGNRWFDLKRTGKADAVLSGLKPGWAGTAKLFPIPQLELTADPNLVQNPGY
ncbi:RagB/SusD family nutrient uptake outer membrane protein [Niabella sp. CC-SYL272]|uniref:RagB/SusD family nutrient uptake outer membrane protein n=1 Tax=Niabella agricola TaxID=2891571 RepID=UPI001F2EFA55|nr:RagB/SusD family nutrient uptake outer membrane protein [Niabella agricola]MCF3109566.1 RagB/SusD family nutrient uptake outer membrane protein [Niabella agricola]